MPQIQSNKPLKYDPIKPQLEGIIELKIIEVKDYLDEELTVITVRDRLVDTNQVLAVRNKTLTFDQIDELEQMLSDQIVIEGTYTEKREQLLQAGLKYITQNDPNPIYFSTSEDWEPLPEQPPIE